MSCEKSTSVVYDGTASIDYRTFVITNLPVEAPSTLGQLAETAHFWGWRYVWLAQSHSWDAFKAPGFWHNSRNDLGIEVKLSGVRKGDGALLSRGGHVFCRVMRTDDPRWGIASNCASDVALTLATIHDVLKVHPVLSPSVTGLNSLKARLSENGWMPEPVAWPAREFIAEDIQFLRRDLHPGPYGYMHMVDRNGAYLNAARSSDFGTAGATSSDGPFEDRRVPKGFGVAEVIVTAIAPGVAHLVPMRVKAAPQLVSFPVLRLLHDAYADYTVVRMTRFGQTHRALRVWSEPLVALRSAESAGARRAGKAIAIQSIGMFGHQWTGDCAPWHYLPHWRAHIIGTNALTFAHMIRLLESDGMPVLMAYTDSIAFLSKDPDPPEYLTANSGGVGGYKRVASFDRQQMMRLVRLAQDEDLRVSAWLEAVKNA